MAWAACCAAKTKTSQESNKRTGPNHLEIEIRRRVSYLVTSSSNMTYEITVNSHVLLAARVSINHSPMNFGAFQRNYVHTHRIRIWYMYPHQVGFYAKLKGNIQ